MNKRQITGLLLAVILLLAALAWGFCTRAMAQELAQDLAQARTQAEASAAQTQQLRTENAALAANVAQLEQLRADAEQRAALFNKLRSLPRITRCTVSHYCCEKYAHICGTGNGITASGAPVQAGVSVAVDPTVIPLGSTVYVDYGDGIVHTYIAHDTGGAVNGSHIDVAVETHADASRLGMKNATVWWEEK